MKQPVSRRAPAGRLLLGLSLLALAGCGGASASGGASSTDPRPPADQGLATWPRQDPPPFPISALPTVVSPIDGHLPREQLLHIAAFIRWYEQDPFDPAINQWEGDVSTRTILLAWASESPDVHVLISPFVDRLAEARGEDPGFVGAYTTMGGLFGMAAHAIEQPELDPADPVRQAEGLASGLRWYEAAVRRGAPHSPLLDELIGVRDRGELPDWFAAHVSFAE